MQFLPSPQKYRNSLIFRFLEILRILEIPEFLDFPLIPDILELLKLGVGKIPNGSHAP